MSKLGRFIRKVANTKVAGVSLGSMAGGGHNPLLTLAGEKARGGNVRQNVLGDLRSGARNAAVLAPLITGASRAAGGGTEVAGAGDGGAGPVMSPIRPGVGGVPESVLTPGRFGDEADPSRFRQIAGDVGGFLSKHKNDITDYASAAEDLYGNYRQGKLQDKAMAEFDANAPLRRRQRDLLLDETRPDLSTVFADPTIRYRRVGAGG